MKVLGINAFHADSSACVVIDGKVVSAIEEERLLRIKHWAGYPEESIKACLKIANVEFSEIDKIAINRDASSHKSERLLFAIKNRPSLTNVFNRIKNRKNVGNIPELLSKTFKADLDIIKNKLVPIEHHLAHLSSTFFTSPYEDSVVLSIDGFGDFISTMWGLGEKNNIEISNYVAFPHSLGMLYQSITQFLGFWNYGDEYKVMGMAAYGKPLYINEIEKLISTTEKGKFELNIEYFNHPDEGISMEFDGGYPVIGPVFSDHMITLLGEPRLKEDIVQQKHKDIACSLQFVYEKTLFHILSHLNDLYPGYENLCLSGGCAQNSLANGKITTESSFKNVWIQPAAGDAGGALGAALAVSNMRNGEKRNIMKSPSLGIKYSNDDIKKLLDGADLSSFEQLFINDENQLLDSVTNLLIQGKVIGFFHGSFEWGPRALGNRSIIVDPRIKNMKDLLNRKIKKRESFRPFAPSILFEKVGEWFEKNEEVPFMTHVFNIKEEKRRLIPAVTHEDGTGRLQSVTKDFNNRYYKLIKLFGEKTNVPIILNTSFNENEPIVNTPKEALDCFLRTDMDTIVLENYIISR